MIWITILIWLAVIAYWAIVWKIQELENRIEELEKNLTNSRNSGIIKI